MTFQSAHQACHRLPVPVTNCPTGRVHEVAANATVRAVLGEEVEVVVHPTSEFQLDAVVKQWRHQLLVQSQTLQDIMAEHPASAYLQLVV